LQRLGSSLRTLQVPSSRIRPYARARSFVGLACARTECFRAAARDSQTSQITDRSLSQTRQAAVLASYQSPSRGIRQPAAAASDEPARPRRNGISILASRTWLRPQLEGIRRDPDRDRVHPDVLPLVIILCGGCWTIPGSSFAPCLTRPSGLRPDGGQPMPRPFARNATDSGRAALSVV
jgi:hypothetical protein